jgi:Ca2+/H+ antiporter
MLWLRAAVIHPVVPVAVLVAASHQLAQAGEVNLEIVILLGVLCVPAPIASTVLTAVMVNRSSVSRGDKAWLVGATLFVGYAAVFVGFFIWGEAVTTACEGGYECPL